MGFSSFVVPAFFATIAVSTQGHAKVSPEPVSKIEEETHAVANDRQLLIEDLIIGTGAEAVDTKTLTVHYIGTFPDGRKFDSSYDRNKPLIFQLGVGQVIPGWDQGLKDMKVSGKRKLTIPSELAYGSKGAGTKIPPNATLVFEIELIGVE